MGADRPHSGHLGPRVAAVKRWIIGRALDCDGVLVDEYASPHHAEVVQDDDGHVSVADLGSTNGTYVRMPNGLKAKVRLGTRLPLYPGCVLIVGRTEIPWTVQP
jgi:predicted component of type VI protein secretion system